jgi:hypothetical protein
MSHVLRTSFLAALGCALVGGMLRPAAAQDEDPRAKIKELAQKIAEELQNVDKLLLQREAGGARAAMDRASSGMAKLLEESKRGQAGASQGIADLIAELDKLRSQSSQSSDSDSDSGSQSQNRPQPQDGQQRRESGQRDQTKTADLIQQGQTQPPPKPDGTDPKGGQEAQIPPQQTRGQELPDGATERVQREAEAAEWGSLPKYLQYLQRRGGMPEVPEKYRKFLEAYVKQSADKQGRK